MPPDLLCAIESTGYVFGACVTAHLITINAWAMDGFKDILWYGRGVADILPEVGVLVLISLVAFGVGLARFKLA